MHDLVVDRFVDALDTLVELALPDRRFGDGRGDAIDLGVGTYRRTRARPWPSDGEARTCQREEGRAQLHPWSGRARTRLVASVARPIARSTQM